MIAMRTLFISVFATLFSLSFAFGAGPTGGGEGGGTADSLKSKTATTAKSTGVNVVRLSISPEEINPNFNKVARWDTLDLDMYHVDMTIFRDTLSYVLHNPATGNHFTCPHHGRITSGFGRRKLYGRKFHKGLDIDLETGDKVVAAMNGKVRIARYSSGYGNFVLISHEGGLETLYGHLSELSVVEGQEVNSGQLIGLGGSTGQSTGSHLHFEVRVFGEQVDPSWILDPQSLMPYKSEVKIDASWFDHLLHVGEKHHHIVQEGETLDEICAMYEMEKLNLCRINELEEDVELSEGMRLRLD